jgi:energy-coupling factor transporter ATP-binding protein EcfA2
LIRSIRIGHLKSYSSAQEITLTKASGEIGSGYNVIVGENNSGKSTLITLVRHVFSREQTITIGQESRREPNKPLIEIIWEDSEEETVTLGIDPNVDGAIFRKTGDRHKVDRKFRFVPSRRPFASEYNTQGMTPRDYEENELFNRINNQSYFDAQLSTSIASFFIEPANKALFLEALKSVDPHSMEFSTDNVAGKNVLLYEGPSKRSHVLSDMGSKARLHHVDVTQAAPPHASQ